MSKNTDVPALSGAAIAGSVSIFMGDGAYGMVSAIVSVTLMAFIKTYAWNEADTKSKAVVYSMVFALASLPLIATIYEAFFYCAPYYRMILSSNCLVEFGHQNDTWVNDAHLAPFWVLIFVVTYFARRRGQLS